MLNGWFAQPWIDSQALVVFGGCLEHIDSGNKAVANKLRYSIVQLVRNYAKTTSRIKMLIKFSTAIGQHNYGKQIKEVMDVVEGNRQAADALGAGYVDKAVVLKETVLEVFHEQELGTDHNEIESLHNAIVDIVDVHQEKLEELANVCEHFIVEGCDDDDQTSMCGHEIGKESAGANDKLLGMITDQRKILILTLTSAPASFEGTHASVKI